MNVQIKTNMHTIGINDTHTYTYIQYTYDIHSSNMNKYTKDYADQLPRLKNMTGKCSPIEFLMALNDTAT